MTQELLFPVSRRVLYITHIQNTRSTDFSMSDIATLHMHSRQTIQCCLSVIECDIKHAFKTHSLVVPLNQELDIAHIFQKIRSIFSTPCVKMDVQNSKEKCNFGTRSSRYKKQKHLIELQKPVVLTTGARYRKHKRLTIWILNNLVLDTARRSSSYTGQKRLIIQI